MLREESGRYPLTARWCPAYRQHEPGPGSRVEHVKARPETAGQHSNRLSAVLRAGELQAAQSVRGRVQMPDAPSHVPHAGLDRAHAAGMPDTTWAVSGYLPDSSRSMEPTLVLMSSE